MANPVFRSGPITFPVAKDVSAFRFVQLGADGIQHGGENVFGAVSDAGSAVEKHEDNKLTAGNPTSVAVHIVPSVVRIETEDGSLALGDTVASDADGKAVAGEGAGIVVRAPQGGFVKVLLAAPGVASGGGNDDSTPGEQNLPGDDKTPSK